MGIFFRRTFQAIVVLLQILIVWGLTWARPGDVVPLLGVSMFLALCFLLLGPWRIESKRKDPLLEKPRNPRMALIIYGLFLLTYMPLVTIYAVLWAGMSLYQGAILMLDARVGLGLAIAAIPLLGASAVYTLWALARFYVREPRRNPPHSARYLTGLCIGIGVAVFVWTMGDLFRFGNVSGYAAGLASLPLIPCAFFLLLMLWNRLRPQPTAD